MRISYAPTSMGSGHRRAGTCPTTLSWNTEGNLRIRVARVDISAAYLFRCWEVEQEVRFEHGLRSRMEECNVLVLEAGEVTFDRLNMRISGFF